MYGTTKNRKCVDRENTSKPTREREEIMIINENMTIRAAKKTTLRKYPLDKLQFRRQIIVSKKQNVRNTIRTFTSWLKDKEGDLAELISIRTTVNKHPASPEKRILLERIKKKLKSVNIDIKIDKRDLKLLKKQLAFLDNEFKKVEEVMEE
jgi:hypothetical protein